MHSCSTFHSDSLASSGHAARQCPWHNATPLKNPATFPSRQPVYGQRQFLRAARAFRSCRLRHRWS
ncbi:MAG TPA: hypothetical protein VF798_06540 [Burkholderiaceae bacterium]